MFVHMSINKSKHMSMRRLGLADLPPEDVSALRKAVNSAQVYQCIGHQCDISVIVMTYMSPADRDGLCGCGRPSIAPGMRSCAQTGVRACTRACVRMSAHMCTHMSMHMSALLCP